MLTELLLENWKSHEQARVSIDALTVRLYNEKQGSPRQVSRVQSVLTHLVGQKLRQEIQDGVGVVVAALRDIFMLDPIPMREILRG